MTQQYLTNERIRNKFKNNFDLANYAIGLARAHIHKGEPETLSELIHEIEELPNLIAKKPE